MDKTSKKDFIVVIPAYEPPPSFVEYALDILKAASLLVVVDDGSGDRYSDIFNKIAENKNVKLITLKKNKGKGNALKCAFSYIVSKYSHEKIIVTADCDGQHKVNDVVSVYKSAMSHPDTLVLGGRSFNGDNVPWRSRVGNGIARNIYRALYGQNVTDTQTGLRGFSVLLASGFLGVGGRGFEYEMGVLIYAVKKKIPILQIPIETVYSEKGAPHSSHYRPLNDSIKIFFTVLFSMNVYILSSLLSGVVDVLVFSLIIYNFSADVSPLTTMTATVVARVSSSFINFILNYKYVFASKTKSSIFKYYLLCALQMSLSYLLVLVFGNIIGFNFTVSKIIIDICLGILSYRIQRTWVFSERKSARFYSVRIRIIRFFAKLFSKKYKCNLRRGEDAAVYVCRHLDMHGPYTTLKWLPFDAHLLVLGVFFKKSSCYKQYKEYTFRKKGRGRLAAPRAFLASRIVPGLVSDIKAIPVYRDKRAAKTLKTALECLMRGEDIIVYPDVEYNSKSPVVSDIYDGFLYLGELYHKSTGKDLKFIPLYIDDEKSTLTAGEAVTARNFLRDRKRVKHILMKRISNTE